MPAVLAQRLDEEQREVLRGISHSTKACRVVDALAGTGKSHLARCLINRWGSLRNAGQACLVMALRTRTLRQEFLEALLADKVALFEVRCSLVALVFDTLSSLSFFPIPPSTLWRHACLALLCFLVRHWSSDVARVMSSAISLGLLMIITSPRSSALTRYCSRGGCQTSCCIQAPCLMKPQRLRQLWRTKSC